MNKREMLLAINTSTLQFGVALLAKDGTVLAENLISGRTGHFGGLVPTIDFIIRSLGSDIREVKAVAVAKGPGSFTGLRVGISAAKGLCHGLDVPIMGISSLAALAFHLSFLSGPIAAILDSRRGEVFTAKFSTNGNQLPVRRGPELCLRFEELPSCFEKSTTFIGNDFSLQARRLKEIYGTGVRLAPACGWHLRASALGSLALGRFHAQDFDDLQELQPVYLRPPDIRHNPYPLLNPE